MSTRASLALALLSRSRRVAFRHPRGEETGREGAGAKWAAEPSFLMGVRWLRGAVVESNPGCARRLGCGRWFPVSARSSLAIPWKLLELAGPRLGLGSDWLALGPTDRPFKSPVHLYFTTA